MLNHTTRVLTVIAVWQLTCAVVKLVCGPLIGRAVLSAYTSRFGDVQASFVTFWRIYTYTEIVAITAVATAVGVALLHVLERRPTSWKRTVATFIAWHTAVVAALIASDESGLFWVFFRLDRLMFGMADDYSLRTMVLPRLIAWVVSSTAAIAAVLWLRGKFAAVEVATAGWSKSDLDRA